MEPDSEHQESDSGLPRPACKAAARGPHTLPVAGGRNDRLRLRIASGVVLGVVAGLTPTGELGRVPLGAA